MKRGALELSVGTLVTMILGMLIVTGGLLLVWNLVERSGEIAGELDGSARASLQELLSKGQLVAVAPATQEVKPGGDIVAGVAVLNKLDDDTTFDLNVRVQKDGALVNWQVVYYDTLDVARHREEIAVIVASVPESAPSGDYTFFVTVRADGETYDSVRFFSARVV